MSLGHTVCKMIITTLAKDFKNDCYRKLYVLGRMHEKIINEHNANKISDSEFDELNTQCEALLVTITNYLQEVK